MSGKNWRLAGALVLSIAVLCRGAWLLRCAVKSIAGEQICLAAYGGDLQTVRMLLALGADVDTENDSGSTPLTEAIAGHRMEMVKFLVSKGANVKCDGGSPIGTAVRSGDPRMVELLLGHGATLNVDDGASTTLMQYAVLGCSTKMVSFLISHGLDINRKNSEGWPPIHYAFSRSMQALLLAHGARVDSVHLAAQLGMTPKVRTLLARNPKLLNKMDSEGWTPLHCAVRAGQVETARFLLDRGADVNRIGDDGLTPLHVAVSVGTARLLVERGADLNAASVDGRTPLHTASSSWHTGIVEYLISRGADVNAKDNAGKTVLHYESETGNARLVKELLTAGADANSKGVRSRTPLHYAVLNLCNNVVRPLLSARNVDVNTRDDDGRTPLDYAIDLNDQSLARLLEQHGAKHGSLGNNP